MRMEGWSKLGYYPTPNRVTDIVAAGIHEVNMGYNAVHNHEEVRVMDPCCGDGNAVARFTAALTSSPAYLEFHRGHPDIETRVFGIELDRNRSSAARRRLHQVWNADIDNTRIRENSYNFLWLNPPYDWSDDEDNDGSRRLESRFLKQATPGLITGGILIYIIPQHVLAWDARYLLRNYRDIQVGRFPDPEYDEYRQVVVIARRAPGQRAVPTAVADLEFLAHIGPELPPLTPQITVRPSQDSGYALDVFPKQSPVRVLRHNPAEVVQSMQDTGAWQIRELQDTLSTTINPVRLRPIEPLPEGHAAMVAANSMMDNILIRDPDEQLSPIVIRGFFRKKRRETFRNENMIKRTDFFESNIRALDVTSGAIEEVGDSPERLRDFMSKHGPAIRAHIAHAYPPSVDTDSPRAQNVKDRISRVARPLLGKQVDAAVIAATHLSQTKHVNLFATQGSGKTCTATAIARGIDARKIVVVTPARVVPNWIDEIQAMFPDAIVRVVQDQNPIGSRREPTPAELRNRPAAVGRASLEEIRRLEHWATPDNPLWVIFKKDSCRSSYPTTQGLRVIGEPAAETPPFRPLERLIEAERKPVSLSHWQHPDPPAPRRLYRNQIGKLQKLPADHDEPLGTCPHCWYPLTDDERWTGRDRDSVCLNPHEWPRFPARTPDMLNDDPDAAVEMLSCQAPIATATRTDTGRAVFSYGDYASRYLNHWMDLLIVDEAQDYKARDSAQGQTVRRLAQRAKKTLFLTGTPFGGKVSEVFYTLLASDSAFSREFGYSDLTMFKRLYGREEFTIGLDDSAGHSVGARSRRRESRTPPKEIPGYHPALLEHFWHNTIFMSLDQVDQAGRLPSFSQYAELIDLDPTPQTIGSNGTARTLSQSQGYQTLDTAMAETVKRELINGNKQLLGKYLHETLCYPENCWQGAEPTDSYDNIIVSLPPLDSRRLYPKERKLLEILEDQRAAGRRCLVYCTHTNRRDTTQRLSDLLAQRGFRALRLQSDTVNTEKRTAWLQDQAARNDVIITQPRLVETGVNLLEYPTIIWYEIEYSMFTTEQASARSYRITQTEPVEVYYLAYADTMQERALRVIARKADVSRTFHGDLSKTGLSAFNPDPDDIRDQLARELLATGDQAASQRPRASITFVNHPGDPKRPRGGPVAAPVTPPAPQTLVAAPRPRYSNLGAVQGSLFE